MTFWIGVIIGVIVGANLAAFMLALCMAANENDRADREWNRGDPVRGHSPLRDGPAGTPAIRRTCQHASQHDGDLHHRRLTAVRSGRSRTPAPLVCNAGQREWPTYATLLVAVRMIGQGSQQ